MPNTSPTEFPFAATDLITSATGLLYDYLVRANRNEGKMRFKNLTDMQQHFVAEMPTSADSTARVNLKLDYSEYRGDLNFTGFKKFLTQLIGLLAQALDGDDDIPLRQEAQAQRYLISLPAAIEIDDQLNVLMMGFDLRDLNEITIELLFFDPTQFSSGATQT